MSRVRREVHGACGRAADPGAHLHREHVVRRLFEKTKRCFRSTECTEVGQSIPSDEALEAKKLGVSLSGLEQGTL